MNKNMKFKVIAFLNLYKPSGIKSPSEIFYIVSYKNADGTSLLRIGIGEKFDNQLRIRNSKYFKLDIFLGGSKKIIIEYEK